MTSFHFQRNVKRNRTSICWWFFHYMLEFEKLNFLPPCISSNTVLVVYYYNFKIYYAHVVSVDHRHSSPRGIADEQLSWEGSNFMIQDDQLFILLRIPRESFKIRHSNLQKDEWRTNVKGLESLFYITNNHSYPLKLDIPSKEIRACTVWSSYLKSDSHWVKRRSLLKWLHIPNGLDHLLVTPIDITSIINFY